MSGKQVMRFQTDSLDSIEAVDYFLRVCHKLGLITESTDDKSWILAYSRFEKNYKEKKR